MHLPNHTKGVYTVTYNFLPFSICITKQKKQERERSCFFITDNGYTYPGQPPYSTWLRISRPLFSVFLPVESDSTTAGHTDQAQQT